MKNYKAFTYSMCGVIIGSLLSLTGQYLLFVYQMRYQDYYNVLNQRISLIDRVVKLNEETYKVNRLTSSYSSIDIFMQRLPESINEQVIFYNTELHSVMLLSKLYFGSDVASYIHEIEIQTSVRNINSADIINLLMRMEHSYKDNLFTTSFWDDVSPFVYVLFLIILCILACYPAMKVRVYDKKIKKVNAKYETWCNHVKKLDEHVRFISNK